MKQPSDSDALALVRYAATSWIQEALKDNLTFANATALASHRTWGGKVYSASTLESWYYQLRHQGFDGLRRQPRKDKGLHKALSPETCQLLLEWRQKHPQLAIKALVHQLIEQGTLQPATFSLPSVYRFLAAQQLDPRSIKCNPPVPPNGRFKEDDWSWMLNVLQGQMPVSQLIVDVNASLPEDAVRALYDCVQNKPLRFRNRALAVLCHKKGIRKSEIEEFLRVGAGYVDYVLPLYQQGGVLRLSSSSHTAPKKYEQDVYRETVFAVLHSPPSSYGINRTTWKEKDIQKVMADKGLPIGVVGISRIIRSAKYSFRKAKKVLTSNDPEYRQKLQEITNILRNLKPNEKFFSVDEFGPFAVKIQGGRSLMPPGEFRTVPQYQKSKGSLILTAALELSENQVTHFYSEKKNTEEMLKLLELLLVKYADQACIYFSWDAASWHASRKLNERVAEINSAEYQATHKSPIVKLAPLPSCAQFLNVIESVFSGMARAIIHNSDYQSVEECKSAIDRYYAERNQHFKDNPRRAGKQIWGMELVSPVFDESNNCKDPRFQNRLR